MEGYKVEAVSPWAKKFALEAKEIAEKKFMDKDYEGANKFSLKAQSLDPNLDGLSEMISALNVYLSAENKISGEVDWYYVLGVDYLADDKTVRRQYHMLALILHPDKNKFFGADGAFKLVQEAWVLLSDKEKRLAYDQKLNRMGRQQRVSTQTKVPSAQHNANVFHSAATSHTKTLNENTWSRPKSVPSSSQNLDIFGTICRQCTMRDDVSHFMMLCPNCCKPFMLLLQKIRSPKRTNRVATRNPCYSRRNGGQSSGCEGFGGGNSTHGPGNVVSTLTAGEVESVVQICQRQLKVSYDLLERAQLLKRERDQLKRNLEEVKESMKHTSEMIEDLACTVDPHFKRRRV